MIGLHCNKDDINAYYGLIPILEYVIILKDNNGSVVLPEYDFNGIGNLIPGYGYQLKLTQNIDSYNICD